MNKYIIGLCSGTHFVTRALRDAFPSVRIISYDIDPWCATNSIPNHEFRLCDIRDIDVEALKQEAGCFLIVWGSPPCTQYSIARSYDHTPRDLTGENSILKACMSIIEALQPIRWVL